MSVKISELPILDSLADNDVLAGVDVSGNVTSKIEMGTLKNYIDTNTQYTAGTNIDITNNVVSAPNVYNKDEMDSQIEELQSEVDSLSTIFNAFPTESGEGESLSLDGTAETKFKKIDLKGNTSQTGTPTPSSPIPVNVVSGDNSIEICGKNLFDKDSVVGGFVNADGTIGGDTNAYRTSDFIPIQPNTAYYKTLTQSPRTKYYDINKVPLNTTTYQDISIGGNAGTFTTPNNAYYLRFSFPITGGTVVNIDTIMVHKGSTAITYEPYIGNTYNIDLPVENLINLSTITENKRIGSDGNPYTDNSYDLSDYIEVQPSTTYTYSRGITSGGSYAIAYYDSTKTFISRTLPLIPTTSTSGSVTTPANAKYARITDLKTIINQIQFEKGSKANSYTPYGTTPIELCKIGTYQDYIYKSEGNWYKYGAIEKIVLDGTENGWQNSFGESLFGLNLQNQKTNVNSLSFNNYYTFHNVQSGLNAGLSNGEYTIQVGSSSSTIYIKNTNYTTTTDFKTWLSTHNTIVYYPLATPTSTQITYQPLIEQLNLLEKAQSKENQTNISQVNNDLPFIISAEAIMSLQNVLDRIELLES